MKKLLWGLTLCTPMVRGVEIPASSVSGTSKYSQATIDSWGELLLWTSLSGYPNFGNSDLIVEWNVDYASLQSIGDLKFKFKAYIKKLDKASVAYKIIDDDNNILSNGAITQLIDQLQDFEVILDKVTTLKSIEKRKSLKFKFMLLDVTAEYNRQNKQESAGFYIDADLSNLNLTF